MNAILAYLQPLILTVHLHVFREPFTPPVPFLYYVIGAACAVGFSFVLIAFFAKNPRGFSDYPTLSLNESVLGKVVCKPFIRLTIQLASVVIFGLVLATGFFGNSNPIYNFAPTFIWVIWWVGLAYISALIGNFWEILSPWKIIFEWAERLLYLVKAKKLVALFEYPEKIGVWPALVLFFTFAWIENVYTEAVVPSRIAQIILIYSCITWAGMICFGKDVWLRYGEAFSITFNFLGKFAPIALKKSGRITLRPFASGLLDLERVSTSHMLFVLLILATVTFDGFTATLPWMDIQKASYNYLPHSTLLYTLGLITTILIFVSVYIFFCFLMTLLIHSKERSLEIGKSFVYTLIPIALAYHIAHFMLFLVVQGQLIIPLASDPFGVGWDLFGSSNYRVIFTLVSPAVYWITSVLSIIIGHIIAVFLAHSVAVRIINPRNRAIRSQFPMLVLMIGYTIASLWIITQPMYMAPM